MLIGKLKNIPWCTNHISGMKYEAFLCVTLPSLVRRHQKHWRQSQHGGNICIPVAHLRCMLFMRVWLYLCVFCRPSPESSFPTPYQKREMTLNAHMYHPRQFSHHSLCFCCFASQMTSQPLIDEAKIFKKKKNHILCTNRKLWKQWCELTWNPVMNWWWYNIQCAKCAFFFFFF